MEYWRVFALFLIIPVLTCVHPCLASSATLNSGSNDDYCERSKVEAPDISSSAVLRLNFAGRFLADVSTYNNYNENFNTSTFDPLKYPGWNPRGTGDFRLVACAVTQVCLADGQCVSDHEADHIVGQPIIGSNSTTTGKLVDLDPDDQTQSQLWGLVVGVDGFFKGDFTPRSFNHMHACEGPGCKDAGDTAGSAVFLSTLENVKWIIGDPAKQSNFASQVKSLRCVSGFQLYIKLNVYNMAVHSESPDFPYGRVTGTIYAKVSETPHPYGPYTRMMWRPPGPGGGHVPFYVDANMKKVVLDFGNSVTLDVKGNVVEQSDGPLHLLLYKGKKLNCELRNSRAYILGKISLGGNDWFQRTAGIIELSVHPGAIGTIENTPLAVIQQVSSTHCEPVLERQDGLFVQAIDNRVARKEPNSEWKMKFRAFQFGRPAEEVIIRPNQTSPENDSESAIEVVSTEPSGNNGISSITFRSRDPGEPRKEKQLDGEIYRYTVMARQGDDGTEFIVQDLDVSVHLYSEYTIPEEVTWHDHVYPIFQQYANLYPAMKQIINLASYEDVVRKTKLLKHAFTLDERDPNHMPVTRDLSSKKRQMILSWLDDPKLGTVTLHIDELKKILQVALQLELSTIPPYLSALFSIKDGNNEEVAALIRSVVVDEMKHMALVANLLNAIGGAPKLNDKSIVPSYPAPLPGGANPGLVVKLARCSLNQIRTVFQGIERPNCNKNYSPVIQYLRIHKKRLLNFKVSGDELDGISMWQDIAKRCEGITTRPQTIGAIYIHEILCPMVKLHMHNKVPFIGGRTKQITRDLWLSNEESFPFAVHDLRSAVAAIVDIATEGEGTDPCDPYDERGELSHFFKFAEIVHGRRLKETVPDNTQLAHFFDNFFECYEDMNCTKTYSFVGKIVPFYENGVWPTISNPHTDSYPPKSQVRKYSDNFNMVYTGLLMCIHEAFNGAPNKMKECIGMMSSLAAWGKKLVQTPIDPKGDPEIGPNAAPTFQFYEPSVNTKGPDSPPGSKGAIGYLRESGMSLMILTPILITITIIVAIYKWPGIGQIKTWCSSLKPGIKQNVE